MEWDAKPKKYVAFRGFQHTESIEATFRAIQVDAVAVAVTVVAAAEVCQVLPSYSSWPVGQL